MKIIQSILLFILFALPAVAQHTGSIRGRVITSDNQPASDVNVILLGTNQGTPTNSSGYFEFRSLAPGNYTIAISFVGHETIERSVEVVAGQASQVEPVALKESARQLSEIVITGDKVNPYEHTESDYVAKQPLKKLENAQVYTTVTKELLKEQLVFSVDDAVKNAPGIQKMWEATGRSGDGGAYYNSRGFILQSQLRNGVAGNVTARIDAANLERVEVIKGPSATLFGSTLTSYGGLINRVTKKPYETFGGELSYAAGSYGFNRISADINTPLDEDKKLLLRVNTAWQSEGSFQDNGFDKSLVFSPSLSYQVNDRLSVRLDAELYKGSNTSKQIIFFYYPSDQLNAHRADELGIDYKRSYSTNSIFQTSSNANLFGQINYQIANRWTSQTNFTTTSSFSNGPYAYYYVIPNSVVTGDATATGADYLVRADQSTANNTAVTTEFQENVIGEFNLGSIRNRVVAGLDYFSQNSNQLFYGVEPFDIIRKNGVIPTYGNFNMDKLDSALQGNAVWKYPYNFKTNTYSAYASDVINLTDKLIASGAIRVDHFRNLGSFDEASNTYSQAYQQTAFSPKFGLLYQAVKDKVSLFMNYQNGFTNKTGTDYKGKAFKPEQANQVEGGVKIEALSGRISSTISYYNIRVQNLVRPYAANPNFSIQDGTQLSKGVEVELIANPFTGFNMVTGFAYNDSKYTKSADDVLGRRPTTAMSPYTANAWLSYKLFHGSARGLGFGAGANYASDNKIQNSVSNGVFILPAYTVIGATAFYELQKIRFAVKVDNLTNKQYWIGYTTMNPQKLRSITASLTIRF